MIDYDYILACEDVYEPGKAYIDRKKEYICLLCGCIALRQTAKGRPVHCPDCRNPVLRARMKHWRELKAPKPEGKIVFAPSKPKPKKKTKLSFSEILHNAEKEGLSYGQYVLKYNL